MTNTTNPPTSTDSLVPRLFTWMVLGAWVITGCWLWPPAVIALLIAAAIAFAVEVMRLYARPPVSLSLSPWDYGGTISIVLTLAAIHLYVPRTTIHFITVLELLAVGAAAGWLHEKVAEKVAEYDHIDSFELSFWAAAISTSLLGLTSLLREPNGQKQILTFAAILIASDTGGFVIGRGCKLLKLPSWLGWLKHAPAPRLSPRKTIAGFMGAIVLGPAIVAVLCVRVWHTHASWLISFAIALGALGQAGDLYISSLKRLFGIKDMASRIFGILPGMGGVGDRVDSIIFTAPIFYLTMLVTGQLAP